MIDGMRRKVQMDAVERKSDLENMRRLLEDPETGWIVESG
jgi:hypothetical protein